MTTYSKPTNALKKVLCIFIIIFSCQVILAQQLAFPSAYGAGAYASGGRGGVVVHVTNLNNSGPGSFREAVTMTVPRTIVFDVSGVINLSSLLYINNTNNDLTIAGQTAPEGGITIAGDRFYLHNASNIIVRHIRFKGGVTADTNPNANDNLGNDSFSAVSSITNQIFDHCSFAFGADECASWYSTGNGDEVNNVTIQNCFFAESIKGSIIGKQSGTSGTPPTISFISNLFYNSGYRFPNISGDNARIDIINNVVWNSDGRLIRGNGSFDLNHIGNYYNYGNTLLQDKSLNVFRFGTIPQIFTSDNLIVAANISNNNLSNTVSNINANNKLTWKFFLDGGGYNYGDQLPYNYFTDDQHQLLGRSVPLLTGDESRILIPDNAGCNARLNEDGNVSDNRDILDANWISQVNAGNFLTKLPISQYVVPAIVSRSRPSNFYINNLHIPEAWYNANVPNGEDHNSIAPSGYTWLEEYLNQVDSNSIVSIAVESVEISPETATLNVPEIQTLNRTFFPEDATNTNGVWSSNNEAVATVSSDGTVSSISEGEATITFTTNDGGFTDEAIITVTNIIIPLESVTITPSAPILDLGEHLQLTTEFFPANTSDVSGTWTSSDEFIVTVSESGLISSVNEGQADISFIVNDGGITQSVTVNVIDNFYGTYFLYNADTDILIQNIEGDASINLTDEGDQINFRSIPEGGDDNPDVESVKITWTGPENGTWIESFPLYAGLPGGHVDLDFEPYTVVEGTYTFTITYYSDNGASGDVVAIDRFSLGFFFNILPTADAGADQVICENESATLTATDGPNYLWNNGETTATIEVTPLVTTMYTVSVYDDLGNFDEDSVTVIVNSNPIADLGIDQTICQGETITLTADGGTSYLWSTGEITDSIEVSPIVETTYDVEVISNGCSSTDSITVFVNEAPNITVSDDIVIVIGDSTTLAVNGSDNYLWSTGETTAFINVNPTDTTTYTVSSLGATGCTTILEVTVIVIPEVIADAGSDTTICRDEIVTLAASGGGTYLWNTGETTAELVVSPLVTTTYTVTVEDDYGYADTDSVTITVNETPDITVSNDVVIVEGESTTLIASGGDNYLWNTGDSTASLIVSPMVTTTYSVISVADGGCADIEQVTVTVIPEVIAYAGEDITICSGEIVTLTATGGGTYLWNTGETVSQFDVVPLITTTYDVTVEDDYGYTDTDSITITVNQTLDITVSNDIMIIDGESTTLVASGGDNYQWSTSETTASIIVSPTITTTYSVTSLGASGCNDTEQITVTVIPEVIAYAGEDITICSGEIVTLNATGGGTYLWNSGDTTSQIEVTPLTTTTYTITVEDDYGNTDTDSVTITVNQTPSITVNDDVTIMNGQSATLYVSGSDNYEWSTGETTETIVVSPTDTTTYTVLSLGEGGCNDLEEVTVTVVPELIANAGADQEICNGESITLSASGGIIYTWNTGETSQQILVSPTVTTTYIVVAEDGFGNSDTDSVKITVNEVPNVTASDDIIIMDGESTTISAIGGNNYQWDTGETSASITVSPSTTTIYTVSTIGVGGCEDTDQVTVTVIPELIANAGDDVTICRGDSVILNATGGETYLWNTGETTSQIEVSPIITTTYTITVENALGYTDTDDVTITVNETPNVTVSQNITITEGESTSLVANGAETYIWNNGSTFSTIVVSPTQTTTYMVIGTSANSCTAEAQVTVTVEEPFFASAGQDERVCSDDIYEVTLTATQGDSYLWSTGETTQTIVVSPLSTTTYIVTVTQGAQEDTDDVTVYVDPNPEVVIINGDSVDIMNGDFITLSAIGANTYEWNNGATQPNIAVSPSTTTTYEVKGYVGDCYDEKQVTVNVIPSVEADAGEDVVICLDEVATLTATGGDEYEWSTGETTQTIQVSPTVTTQYTVTVFNALDFDEDSIIVEVDTDCEDDEDDEEDDEEEVPNTDDPLDFDFKIFPNPASDIVNVKLSGSINLTKIYLYDMTGKLIYKSRVSNENLGMSSTTEIDVSKLLPGIYYIKMVDIYKEISEKLIIQ